MDMVKSSIQGNIHPSWSILVFLNLYVRFLGKEGEWGREPLFAASKRGFFPLKKAIMNPEPSQGGFLPPGENKRKSLIKRR